MQLPRAFLRQLIKNFDPLQPLTGDDERYVPLDDEQNVRGADGSCISELYGNIMLSDPTEPTCQLFTGFPGSGKTTELYRLKRMLEEDQDEPCHVVFIDALKYLDQYNLPTITDVLRVLAHEIDRAATRAEGDDPDEKPGYLQRFWGFLQSDVELKELGFEAYGASLMFEIRNNSTFRSRVEAALRLRFQEFAEEAHEAIASAIVRLREATGRDRVVVVVDSFEKLSALKPEESARMEENVEAIFSSHAAWLRIPCHTIYTFPFWLRFRVSELGHLYDNEPLTLPMIKIREPAQRNPGSSGDRAYGPGVDKLLLLVRRRVEQIEPEGGMGAVFGEDHQAVLGPLIAASGGYTRDLLRMVRDAIRGTKEFPIDSAATDRAIARLAESYEMVLLRANLDVLAHVARHHRLPAEDENLRAAGWLFHRGLLLTYRNGDEWYDLHPMVRRSPRMQERLNEA